jgi:DNA/RNA endonuclease YhcR with UshA esterase domain
MKRILACAVVLAFCAFGLSAAEQPATNATPAAPLTVTAAEAKDHIGTNAVVTGTIVEVYKGSRTVNLNFEKAYPKQPFSAVIFSERTNLFPEVDKLQGKTVELTGKISEYHDRPQIVITSTNQLKVIEKEAK